MNVSIVGSGYVGTTIAACLADIGHDVVNVEIDDEIVATINAGEAPIHESGLEQRIADHAGTNLRATTDYDAVRDTDVTFLCLPTPQSESGSLDLAIMRAGAESLGRALADKDSEHLVVVKSTVLPGTTEDVVGPILEAESGTRIGDGLELAMNPEFLRMGTAVEDFLEPDKVVLGTASEGLPQPSESCTRPFLRARRRTSSRRRSARPNSSSTRTTPFSRRRSRWSTNSGTSPGVRRGRIRGARGGRARRPGFGAIHALGTRLGRLLFPQGRQRAARRRSRAGLRSRTARCDRRGQRRTAAAARGPARGARRPRGARIAVLGLSFKPGTDDVRKSRALDVIEQLRDRGAEIVAYDPVAIENVRPDFPEIEYAESADGALEGPTGPSLRPTGRSSMTCRSREWHAPSWSTVGGSRSTRSPSRSTKD